MYQCPVVLNYLVLSRGNLGSLCPLRGVPLYTVCFTKSVNLLIRYLKVINLDITRKALFGTFQETSLVGLGESHALLSVRKMLDSLGNVSLLIFKLSVNDILHHFVIFLCYYSTRSGISIFHLGVQDFYDVEKRWQEWNLYYYKTKVCP